MIFTFTIVIKSETAELYDEDNCDKILHRIVPSNNIPRVGDILEFGDKNNHHPKSYLVREIYRSYNFQNDKHKFGEYITVYVTPLN